MSELLSQCLPNCSVKLLAGGGELSGEGDTERASREEEKVHMAQAAALSTHAACSRWLASHTEPSAPLEEVAARQHSRKQALQQLLLLVAQRPPPPRFAALAIPATRCTIVLRVKNPLMPLCGYNR